MSGEQGHTKATDQKMKIQKVWTSVLILDPGSPRQMVAKTETGGIGYNNVELHTKEDQIPDMSCPCGRHTGAKLGLETITKISAFQDKIVLLHEDSEW